MPHNLNPNDLNGPTPAELDAIDDEMPLIEAELFLVDAEIRVLTVLRPTELDWRRLRRAERRVMREATAWLARVAGDTTAPVASVTPSRTDLAA